MDRGNLVTDSAHKPTQASARLVSKLTLRFGGWSAVPVEYQEAAWLIHMRLVEAEQDIAYLWQRVDGRANETPERPRIAGERRASSETGRADQLIGPLCSLRVV